MFKLIYKDMLKLKKMEKTGYNFKYHYLSDTPISSFKFKIKSQFK